MHDYNTALQSYQHALAIRLKLFGEEHESTTDIYRHVKKTQESLWKDRKTYQKLPFSSCVKGSLVQQCVT